MELFLNILSQLVLSVWVGSMFAFAALFAPTLFRRLASRAEAGTIAGVVLGRIDALGLVASGILLVVVVLQAMAANWLPIEMLRLLLVVKMLALTLVSTMGIRARMENLKAESGPVHQLPDNAPQKVEFNRLHKLSSMLFGLNMLLGILLIGLSAAR